MFLKFSRLIKKYGVDFTYSLEKKGKTRMGEPINGYGDEIPVHEPLLPYNQGEMPTSSGQTTHTLMTDAGVITVGDMVWYSLKDVPMGTRVQYHGKSFEAVGEDDYTGYSDVRIYYLKAQVNL